MNMGVVNRFDCNKLLPLYYHKLVELAARTAGDEVGHGGRTTCSA